MPMLTVKQLITKLQALPGDAIPVVPNAMEGGYSPLGGGIIENIRHDLVVLDDGETIDPDAVFVALDYGDEGDEDE